MPIKNYTGRKVGNFTILGLCGNFCKHTKYYCKCDCGFETVSTISCLKRISSHKTCPLKYIKKYVGQKRGKLTVIRRAEDKIYRGHPIICWECQCECGKIVIRSSSHLKRGLCVCKECKAVEEAKRFGYMEIKQCHWSSIKRQAKLRKLEFSITIEYIWELFLKQDRKCALSGLFIMFATNKISHRTGETTASLDRIDSSKGYIEGNVQWVHKHVNKMKQNFDEKYFINFCQKIVEFQNEKKDIISFN